MTNNSNPNVTQPPTNQPLPEKIIPTGNVVLFENPLKVGDEGYIMYWCEPDVDKDGFAHKSTIVRDRLGVMITDYGEKIGPDNGFSFVKWL